MLAEVKERLGIELDSASRQLAATLQPSGTGSCERGPAGPEEAVMQARIRRLGQLVAGLVAVGDAPLPVDRAGYGSEVEVEDLRTRRRETYTLVTGEVLDLHENHVTLGSPLGQALLGRRAGERVEVDLPQGRRRLRIVGLVTLPRMLGLSRHLDRAGA
jgi:transcription elongation factor GreA